MNHQRYRCGAPIYTRDKRRPFGYCRLFVLHEGDRCRHHPRKEGEK